MGSEILSKLKLGPELGLVQRVHQPNPKTKSLFQIPGPIQQGDNKEGNNSYLKKKKKKKKKKQL